ncbi:MAG: HDIG protein [uncultured bacterium]|nr:MAG: HDIG protein [uncultured bacterium]
MSLLKQKPCIKVCSEALAVSGNDFKKKLFCEFLKSPSFKIICEYVKVDRPFLTIMINHGLAVAYKALQGAQNVIHLKPDLQFIFEASLIHDIGSIETHAPEIDCFGQEHYIRHGIIGAKIFENYNLINFARVCRNHIGTGITIEDIDKSNLPLPRENYIPETIEEKLICWADKFYSKGALAKLYFEKNIDNIVSHLKHFSPKKAEIFLEWNKQFG